MEMSFDDGVVKEGRDVKRPEIKTIILKNFVDCNQATQADFIVKMDEKTLCSHISITPKTETMVGDNKLVDEGDTATAKPEALKIDQIVQTDAISAIELFRSQSKREALNGKRFGNRPIMVNYSEKLLPLETLLTDELEKDSMMCTKMDENCKCSGQSVFSKSQMTSDGDCHKQENGVMYSGMEGLKSKYSDMIDQAIQTDTISLASVLKNHEKTKCLGSKHSRIEINVINDSGKAKSMKSESAKKCLGMLSQSVFCTDPCPYCEFFDRGLPNSPELASEEKALTEKCYFANYKPKLSRKAINITERIGNDFLDKKDNDSVKESSNTESKKCMELKCIFLNTTKSGLENSFVVDKNEYETKNELFKLLEFNSKELKNPHIITFPFAVKKARSADEIFRVTKSDSYSLLPGCDKKPLRKTNSLCNYRNNKYVFKKCIKSDVSELRKILNIDEKPNNAENDRLKPLSTVDIEDSHKYTRVSVSDCKLSAVCADNGNMDHKTEYSSNWVERKHFLSFKNTKFRKVSKTSKAICKEKNYIYDVSKPVYMNSSEWEEYCNLNSFIKTPSNTKSKKPCQYSCSQR